LRKKIQVYISNNKFQGGVDGGGGAISNAVVTSGTCVSMQVFFCFVFFGV
jgi:hypothetical protein